MPYSLLAMILVVGQDAPAQFYNRAGASVAARDADLARCRAITTAPMVETDRQLTPPIGPPPALPNPPVPPADTIADCMTMRGWTLYTLSPRERARWAALSATARRRVIEQWTGRSPRKWGRLARPAQRPQWHIPR